MRQMNSRKESTTWLLPRLELIFKCSESPIEQLVHSFCMTTWVITDHISVSPYSAEYTDQWHFQGSQISLINVNWSIDILIQSISFRSIRSPNGASVPRDLENVRSFMVPILRTFTQLALIEVNFQCQWLLRHLTFQVCLLACPCGMY